MYKKLLEKIKSAPILPGCYMYKNHSGEILYVGKAKNLRKRVRQYFQKDIPKEPKIEVMIPQIEDVEFVTVKTETEALVLESSLIKKYKPKYNKLQKDDKKYAWIKITNELIPRIIRVRDKRMDGAKYYGPYPNGAAARKTVSFLRKIYPYRVCSKKMFYGNIACGKKSYRNKDCCIRYTKTSRLCLDYHLGLCDGPCDNLISIKDYNSNINQVKKFLAGRQKNVLRKLSGEMKKYALDKEFEKAAVIRDRINELSYITQKIDVSFGEDEIRVREKKRKESRQNVEGLFRSLDFAVPKKIIRIECYDVSNIQGTNAITSMVVFNDGIADKSQYRYFKIRGKETPDDYAMMKEALERRFKYLAGKESKDISYSTKPSLIVVDGGKGQLNMALSVLSEFNLKIPVIGIAKREEEIIQQRNGEFKITRLRRDSKMLHLVQNLRDEAHRFAISRHRNLRSKKAVQTILGDIPGVGKKTIHKLMTKYGSVDSISRQDLTDLIETIGNQSIAVKVYAFFR